MNHIFCIYSSIVGHLGCFQLLVITNKATMNIEVLVSLWYCGASFGCMPQSGIVESSSRSIYSFLRNFQINFQSSCTTLQSHQQWRNVPLFPHPLQHVLSPEILILAILTGVRWNLRVILICNSLITKNLNISLSVSQSFQIPLLWIISLVQYLIFDWVVQCFWWLTSWVHLYFGY